GLDQLLLGIEITALDALRELLLLLGGEEGDLARLVEERRQRVRGVLGEFVVAIASSWHVPPADVVAHPDPLAFELVFEVALVILTKALVLDRGSQLACVDPAASAAAGDELGCLRVLLKVDGHVVLGLPLV